MPKKVVIVDSHVVPDADYGVEQKILAKAGMETVVGTCRTHDEIVDLAKDADGVGLIYADFSRELLERLPKCKVLVRYGVGYDSIDVDAASELGIAVCNIPDYCQEDVATHTMAMLLDIARKVTLFDRYLRAGNWNENHGYEIHRLSTMRLGLVGFGSIARLVASYAKAWGMDVVACDPVVADEVFRQSGVVRVTQDDLFATSDVVSLHVPLNEATHHLICAESIATMKDGVMIVNTARGPIVHLDDLIAALRSNKVKAAALDVVEGEPIRDADHPMWECENLVVNPHSAYYSTESGIEQHTKVAEAAIAVLVDGVLPGNCVNRNRISGVRKEYSNE